MNKVDPYFLKGPATIAFSGGRTSAYLLCKIVERFGGTLPSDIVVCFANTGKEREETLTFVQRVGAYLGVHINWLEYRDTPEGFEVVSHNSASRNGEPFEALINKRKFLPNGIARFCTVELKIRTQEKFIRSTYGWDHWTAAVGFRADEMRRVDNMCGRNGLKKDRHAGIAPMAEAGVVKADVLAFWKQMPFDLGIQSHEGNCDLCFLKRRDKLREIMYDRPDLADWWIQQEKRVRAYGDVKAGGGFRPPNRPDYAQLFETRRKQEELVFEEPDALDLCYCGDAA